MKARRARAGIGSGGQQAAGVGREFRGAEGGNVLESPEGQAGVPVSFPFSRLGVASGPGIQRGPGSSQDEAGVPGVPSRPQRRPPTPVLPMPGAT